jgi:hypothetical protein
MVSKFSFRVSNWRGHTWPFFIVNWAASIFLINSAALRPMLLLCVSMAFSTPSESMMRTSCQTRIKKRLTALLRKAWTNLLEEFLLAGVWLTDTGSAVAVTGTDGKKKSRNRTKTIIDLKCLGQEFIVEFGLCLM